jgi:peptidoglycan-associated lipoprotein
MTFLSVGCKKPVETPKEVIPTPSMEVAKAIPRQIPKEVQSMVQNFQRVFFEVDSASLSPDAKGALDENVEIMQKKPSIIIEIQGHADERGTTQHNLALGEKRGQSVSRYLASQGIASSRIKVVSYGEERPMMEGDSEAIWSRNRRCEFVIKWNDDELEDSIKGTVDPE